MNKELILSLFEALSFSHIKEAGGAFLLGRESSLADRAFLSSAAALILLTLITLPVDREKILLMTLFHSFHKARTGDMNHVQKSYCSWDHEKVRNDMRKLSLAGEKIVEIEEEYNNQTTIEAKIAHDASTLALLARLKEEEDMNNPRAKEWFINATATLLLPESKELAIELKKTASDEWWRRRTR